MSGEHENITLALQQILALLRYDIATERNAPVDAVGGVNYKRWGRTECPENATLVYAGIDIRGGSRDLVDVY